MIKSEITTLIKTDNISRSALICRYIKHRGVKAERACLVASVSDHISGCSACICCFNSCSSNTLFSTTCRTFTVHVNVFKSISFSCSTVLTGLGSLTGCIEVVVSICTRINSRYCINILAVIGCHLDGAVVVLNVTISNYQITNLKSVDTFAHANGVNKNFVGSIRDVNILIIATGRTDLFNNTGYVEEVCRCFSFSKAAACIECIRYAYRILKSTIVDCAASGTKSLYIAVTSSRKLNRHHIKGHAGCICIIPAAAAVSAGPVLYVTEFGTGRSLCCNVSEGVSCLGIGDLIANHTYGITLVEVEVRTVAELNALEVGKLGKSCISEYCVTFCAVPVLNVTHSLAVNCLNSLNVLDLCGARSYNALSVGDLGKSCVGEYCVTLGAEPELNVTGLVASSLNSVNVADLCGVRSYNALSVRELGKSCIGEYCITVGAVPELYVTVLVATSLNCINVNDLCGVNESEVLNIGEVDALCVSKYCLALGAVPVLLATVLVAGGSNLCNVGKTYGCGDNYALKVSLISEGLISPCDTAVGAVPVLDVTVLVATCLKCINVSDVVSSVGIGLLVAVHTNLVTVVEVLVSILGSGHGLTYGAYGVTLVDVGVLALGGDHSLCLTDRLGESLILPGELTNGAVPVLDATSLETGLVLSCYVNDLVTGSALDGVEAPLTLGVAGIKGLTSNLCDSNHHLVERHAEAVSVIPASCTVSTAVVLDVTEGDTSRILSRNENDVVSSRLVGELVAVHAPSVTLITVCVRKKRKSYLVLGDRLGKSLVIPKVTAVLTGVVSGVTVLGTGRSYSRNKNGLMSSVRIYSLEANGALLVALICEGVAELGKDNALEVGKVDKSRVGEYCVTVCAVPVLYVTGSGTSRSNSLNVLDLSGVNESEVLNIGEVDALCVSKYCLALLAVPVLLSTVLVAGSLNLGNVGETYGCGINNVLEVGELSESCISEYCKTVAAVPVLYVTVLVAGRSNSLNVSDLCGVRNGKVLNIGEVTACSISEYCATVCAVPVLLRAVLVAGSLNCGNVCKLGNCRSGNTLEVGELGKSRVGEYCKTVRAVPVLNVTGLVANSLYSLYVNDLSLIAGDNALEVGELGKSSILPYLLALVTVPVLDVTVLVTVSCNSIYVVNLAAGSRKNNALDVGELSESRVGPNLLTVLAEPVLNVTGVVASGSNCVEVNNISVAGSGKNNVLYVGELSKSLILPYSLAVVADPVLDVTLVVAAGLNSLNVYYGTSELGNYDAHKVGKLSAVSIGPSGATVGAVPVLYVTGCSAGSILSSNVLDGVSSITVGELTAVHTVSVTAEHVLVLKLRKNSVLLIDLVLESGVGPYGAAALTRPILDVTVSGTCSVLCFNVLDGVRTEELYATGKVGAAGNLRELRAGSKADCYHCHKAKKQEMCPFHFKGLL